MKDASIHSLARPEKVLQIHSDFGESGLLFQTGFQQIQDYLLLLQHSDFIVFFSGISVSEVKILEGGQRLGRKKEEERKRKEGKEEGKTRD